MIEFIVVVNVISWIVGSVRHLRLAAALLLRAKELGLVKFDDLDKALGQGNEDGRTSLVDEVRSYAAESDDEVLRETDLQLTRVIEVEFGIFVVSLVAVGFIIFLS